MKSSNTSFHEIESCRYQGGNLQYTHEATIVAHRALHGKQRVVGTRGSPVKEKLICTLSWNHAPSRTRPAAA
jgi:hypothetical protein